MSISALHKLDKVVLPSAVHIDQIEDQRWSSEVQTLIERPAGHVHPMFAAVQEERPVIEFTTTQLSTLLSTVGVAGAAVGTTDTYLKKATTTGSEARASLLHKRLRITQGIAYVTSIRLPHNGRATANVVLAASFDGVNDPLAITGSVALAGNLSFAELFTCGPVSVNGVSIPGIKDIEIQTGMQLIVESADGEVWPTFVAVGSTEPSITIQTKEAVNWSTYNLAGTALNGTTGVRAFAKKYSIDSTGSVARVANATMEHILFSAPFGLAVPENTSGQGNETISDTLRCVLRANTDSGVPLAITTGSAIT